MVYVDFEIKTLRTMGDVEITPYKDENVKPNSYEVHLGKEIIIMGDGSKKPYKSYLPYTLKHGEFILGTTQEKITIRRRSVGILKGKSTNARRGLIVETAGVVDTGFSGELTLEMFNMWTDMELTEGMPIAQLIFFKSYQPNVLYGDEKADSHYQNQDGPTLPYNLKVDEKKRGTK